MAKRNVARFTWRSCERHANQICADGIQAISFRIDRDNSRLVRFGDPGLQRFHVAHAFVRVAINFHFLWRGFFQNTFLLESFAHPAGDRAKLHLFQKRDECFWVGISNCQFFDRHFNRDIAFERYEISAEQHLVFIIEQCLAAFWLFDFFCALQQRFDIAVLVDKQRGGF